MLKVHPSNFVVARLHQRRRRGRAGRRWACRSSPTSAPGCSAPDPLLPDEPDAATTLRAGADLVIASGDKLLGGPQAGLLLGDAGLVDRLRRHPLARALRVDKLTLAALQATAHRAADPDLAGAAHRPRRAARRAPSGPATQLGAAGVDVTLVESVAVVGGGGAPEVKLPSWSLSLPEAYAAPLRPGAPAVVGRVERGRLLLDLRCVPADATRLAGRRRAAVGGALTCTSSPPPGTSTTASPRWSGR